MNTFKPYDKHLIYRYRDNLANIQREFLRLFGVNDIFSNSKVYEVMVANELNHSLIRGHSGSRDARDKHGEYEYKHFKESSSNHSWTFNDFSDATIEKLNSCRSVIFAHIDDSSKKPRLDWYYNVPGHIMSKYLSEATKLIQNTRKMINVSPRQIEKKLNIYKTKIQGVNLSGEYYQMLNTIYSTIDNMELATNTTGLLTSNKIFELLTAVELGHNVESEQGGREGAHDAYDSSGNMYEYKISKAKSWTFQDISDNVLKKYLCDEAVLLVVKDPEALKITEIYRAKSEPIVERLIEKLEAKKVNYKNKGKELKRLQVALSAGDLKKIEAVKVM